MLEVWQGQLGTRKPALNTGLHSVLSNTLAASSWNTLPSLPSESCAGHLPVRRGWLILPCDTVLTVTQQSHFTLSKDDTRAMTHLLFCPLSALASMALTVPQLACASALFYGYFSRAMSSRLLPSRVEDHRPCNLGKLDFSQPEKNVEVLFMDEEQVYFYV